MASRSGWRKLAGSALLGAGVAWLGCTAFDDAVLPPRAADASAPDAAAADAPPSTTLGDSFCNRNPHPFCDDFDHTALGLPWDSVAGGPNPTLSLDSTFALSTPNSVLARTTGAAFPKNGLVKRWHAAMTHVHCEMKIRPDPLGSLPMFFFSFDVAWSGGAAAVGGTYGRGDYRTALVLVPADDAGPPNVKQFDGLVEATWKRLAFEVATDQSGLTARAFVEDAVVAEDTVPASTPLSDLTLSIGPTYPGAAEPWAVRYDDVWCDLK